MFQSSEVQDYLRQNGRRVPGKIEGSYRWAGKIEGSYRWASMDNQEEDLASFWVFPDGGPVWVERLIFNGVLYMPVLDED